MKSLLVIPIAALLLALAGCGVLPSVVDPQVWNATIAAELAVIEIEPASGPAPGPRPTPSDTHKREACPTGGWITHGDGHRTRCPSCDPPWPASEPVADTVPSPPPIYPVVPPRASKPVSPPTTTKPTAPRTVSAAACETSTSGGGGWVQPIRQFGGRRGR